MLEFLGPLGRVLAGYKRRQDPNRNVFQNISALYYRENFHSDLIAYFLQHPVAKGILCRWLLSRGQSRSPLLIESFLEGEVVREEGRIDIILYNQDKSAAIIIENKSNGACDQRRQVIDYFNKLSERDVEVCAILYLNKYQLKSPDYTDWMDQEIEQVKGLLTVAQLFGENGFVEEVIEKVIIESNDVRLSALGLELRSLFRTVVNGSKNMESLDSFVEELKRGDNLEHLRQAIRAYGDVPGFLADKFKRHYESKRLGFNTGIWKEKCFYIDQIYVEGKNFGIDVWFSNDRVDISLLVRPPGTDADIIVLKNARKVGWPFGEEMINGRFRLLLPDPLDEGAIHGTIDEILCFLTPSVSG